MPDQLFPEELSEDLQAALDEICEQGNEAMDEDLPREALLFFRQAQELLPPPAERWETYVWLQTAQGDACYALEDFPAALEHFLKAREFCAPEEQNPFVLLRIGQCFRRLGNIAQGAEYLFRAYTLGGEELFKDEEQDWSFLQEREPIIRKEK